MDDPAYDHRRYLAAKASVDDRARDRRVEARLVAELDAAESLSVLEVGAGLGNALERLLSLGLPVAEYTGVDRDPETVAAARTRVPNRLEAAGYTVLERDPLRLRPDGDGGRDGESGGESHGGESCGGESHGGEITIRFETADAFAFVDGLDRQYDLLVGQSFADLVGVDRALDELLPALAPGGYWYFPITFDAGTVFQPTFERSLDDEITRRYHDHMDRIRDGGHSRAGRRLLDAVRRRDELELLAAGGSDWVVRPHDGEYPDDEAYFLHHIVHTVDEALSEHPDMDDGARRRWVRRRREQIEAGELTYVAHQIDALGRVRE